MKKTIFRFAIAFSFLFTCGGGLVMEMIPNAEAKMIEDKHSCVTVQDTPQHKTVSCIGDGTACVTVSTC